MLYGLRKLWWCSFSFVIMPMFSSRIFFGFSISSSQEGASVPIFMSPPAKKAAKASCFSAVCPAVRPLTPITRDAISLYIVEGFRRNLAEMFIIWGTLLKWLSRSGVRGQGRMWANMRMLQWHTYIGTEGRRGSRVMWIQLWVQYTSREYYSQRSY